MAVALAVASFVVVVVGYFADRAVRDHFDNRKARPPADATDAAKLDAALANIDLVARRNRATIKVAAVTFAALVLVQYAVVLNAARDLASRETAVEYDLTDDDGQGQQLAELSRDVRALSARLSAVERYLWGRDFGEGGGFGGGGDPPPPPHDGGLHGLLRDLRDRIDRTGAGTQQVIDAVLRVTQEMRLEEYAQRRRVPATAPAR